MTALIPPGLALGHLEMNGTTVGLWVGPAGDTSGAVSSAPVGGSWIAEVTPPARTALGDAWAEGADATVRLEPWLGLERVSGLASDLPRNDEVHLAPEIVERLGGRWALLISPYAAGPVRLCPREDVQPTSIRVAYGTRVLWDIRPDMTDIVLQRIPPSRSKLGLGDRMRLWFARRPLERALGAPAVALRCVEAVVGDDDRPIIRLADSLFEQIGCESGQEVIVSWAGRQARAIAYRQHDHLRDRHRQQLNEATGKQTVARADDHVIQSRLAAPEHMLAWMSATLRAELDIPRDSVVRVRRDLVAVTRRNLNSLVVPLASLALAGLAIPGIPLIAWPLLTAAFIVLAFAPLRARRS